MPHYVAIYRITSSYMNRPWDLEKPRYFADNENDARNRAERKLEEIRDWKGIKSIKLKSLDEVRTISLR